MTDKPEMTSAPATIGKAEAAALLAAASAGETRGASLYSYRFNAPMLLLWGAINLAVYMTLAWVPAARPWAWPVAGGLGGALSILYFRRYARADRVEMNRTLLARMSANWALNIAFAAGVFVVFAPYEWRQPHAFIGVALGCVYAVFGVWTGWRLIVIGAAVMAASMFAYFAVPPRDFLMVLGLGNGGAMILGGLWLRFLK